MPAFAPYIDALRNLNSSKSGDRAPRHLLQTTVSIRDEQGRHSFELRSVNLSRTGILLDCSGRWPREWGLDTPLILNFGPAGDLVLRPVCILGKVARFIQDQTGKPGNLQVALRFVEPKS